MTEFSRTQTLVSRIQSILREYPCGDTIIFELVQNADDAAAKMAKIVVDPGTNTGITAPTCPGRDDALGWNPCMTSAANPALYFYNSGVFTDRDLKNIQRIGGDENASKRHDATKVGRFGVGFNSTFHLSDVVIFVSEHRLVAMDPACEHLPLHDGKAVDGMMWDFLTFETSQISDHEKNFVRAILTRLEESGLGFSRSRPYKGTIFRLALRQRPSKFWRVVHPVENVMKLIGDFFYSARVSMVLLKNVASIQASVLARHDPSTPPTLDHHYSISAGWTTAAAKTRDSLVTWLKGYTTALQALIMATDDLTVSVDSIPSAPYQKMLPKPAATSLDVAIDFSTGPAFEREPNSTGSIPMHVHHQLGPGNGWDRSEVWALADRAARHHDPLFVPWAASISEGGKRINGRTLCFFPIQGHSQLPVHVHGYFQLSSDRQSIISVERSKWNKAMSTEIVSHAIASGVKARCAAKLPSYSLWPSATYTDSTVRTIADSAIDILADQPTIVTPAGMKKASDALFFRDSSHDVHRRLLLLAPNVATCVDIVAELGWLTAAAEAIARRPGATKVRFAEAVDYRRMLADSGAAAAKKAPMTAAVATILLYRCVEDGAIADVAAMGLRSPIPLLPMADGSVQHWHTPAPKRGEPPRPPLLVAKTKPEHDLLQLLPGLSARLVRWFNAGDEDNEAKPRTSGGGGGKQNPSTVIPGIDDEALALKMCVTVRKLLVSLAPLQQAMELASPDRVCEAISMSLAEPMFAMNDEDLAMLSRQGTAYSQPESGAATPAAPADATAHYDFLPCPPVDPTARIPAELLFSVLSNLHSDAAFTLPLLPVVPPGDTPSTDVRNAPRILQAASCGSPNVILSFGTGSLPGKGTALAGVVDTLVALDARVLQPGIVPARLVKEWVLPGDDAGMVYTMEPQSRHPAAALAARLRSFGSDERQKAAIRKAFDDDAVADSVLLYFAGAHSTLIATDQDVLRRLPVFRDFRDRRVDLVPTQSLDGQTLKPVFLPTAGVPPLFAAALAKSEHPEYSVLRQQTLLAVPRVPVRPLLKSLAITEAALNDVIVAAAPSLPLPEMAATKDAAATNAAWRTVVESVARVESSNGAVTDLMQASVASLRRHPFMPPSFGKEYLLPERCINPTALNRHLLVKTLLVDIQLRADDAAAAAFLESSDDGAAAASGDRYKPLEGAAPLLPQIACFEKPTAAAGRGAEASDEVLDSALKFLGVIDRLQGQSLVHTVQAFCRVRSKLTKDKIYGFAAGLLVLLDGAEMSAKDWAYLRGLQFVPVYDLEGKGDVGLGVPRACRFPKEHALNPIGGKSCIAMDVINSVIGREHQRGLGNCGAVFGWSEKPSFADMVKFINWTGHASQTGSDQKEMVRRLAKGMWSVYDALEAGLKDASMDDQARADLHKELSRVEYVYFPERGVAVRKLLLSRHPSGHRLEPYLGAVDRTMLDRFPHFFDAIGILPKHPVTQVVAVIKDLSGGGKVALTDQHRASLAALLEYLVEVTEPQNLARLNDQVYVPTTDGRSGLAKGVLYDFFNLAAQQPKPDVMHSIVSSHVARGLDMKHSGTKYLQRLQNQNATRIKTSTGRSSIQARGQRYSLVNAIKRILNDYSDHQAVLLEMLQNADDAGATTIRFYLDTRTFKKEKEGLLGEGMAACQGPSLVVMNNSKFTPNDFDALMDIGCGSKEGDSMKIGRFGVGFNTVYHVTDCPSLVSDGRLLYFDPAMRHIDALSSDNPGLSIDFPDDPDLATHFPHQFAPYSLYGVDMTKPLEGTLFRLPLREKAGDHSMSPREWSAADVRQMFHEFADIMKTAMLFLKNVVSIEVNEIDTSGHVTRLHRAGFTNRQEVEAHRIALRDYITNHPISAPRPQDILSRTCRMTVILTRSKTTTEHQFHVTSRIKSSHSMPEKIHEAIPSKLRQKLVQWVTVATEVDMRSGHCVLPNNRGTLACFLPLPVPTGMPCWIHGYFTLSSDRRNLAVEGFSGDSKQTWEMLWNTHLLTISAECLAESLHHLTAKPISSVRDENGFYALWPTPTKVSTQIKPIAEPFFDYAVAQELRLLWSQRTRWVNLSSACFVKSKSSAANAAVKIPDVALPTDIIDSLLVDEDLVMVDTALTDELKRASERLAQDPPVFMSVELVARVLKRRAASTTVGIAVPLKTVLPTLANHHPTVKTSRLADLTNYLTTGDDVVDLNGVPMLYLEDSDDLGIVDPAKTVFVPAMVNANVAHMKRIFPAFKGVVHQAYWATVSGNAKFKKEFWEAYGVISLVPKNLAMCLERLSTRITPAHKGQQLPWPGPQNAPDFAEWLHNVWNFLQANVGTLVDNLSDLGELGKWPLIPAKSGGERVLVTLDNASVLLSGDADAAVQELLALIGIVSLDRDFRDAKVIQGLCKIAEVDGTMVADVLRKAQQQGRFDQMNADQRDALLQYLLRTGENNRGFFSRMANRLGGASAVPMADTIKQLPLFEVVGDDGGWTFGPLSPQPYVVPEGIPITPVCRGLYRKEQPQLGLSRCTKDLFFVNFFFPLYDETTEATNLACKQLRIQPDTYDADIHGACRMSNILSRQAELEHWRVLAMDSTLTAAREAMKSRNTVPLAAALPPLNGAASRRLSEHCIHFVVQRCMPYYDDLAEVDQFPIIRRIQAAELASMNTSRRVAPSKCAQPMTVPTAPFPGVVGMLMQHATGDGIRVVPDVLWRDVSIQALLKDAGVTSRASGQCIAAAAKALQELVSGHKPLDDLRKILREWGLQQPGRVMSREFVYEQFHHLGVSLCLAAVKFGDDQGRRDLAETKFLMPAPTFSVHGCSIRQGTELYAPRNMIRHKHAPLAFSRKPVCDPLLDALPEAMVPAPETVDVVQHLVAFNLSEDSKEHPAPQRRLKTAAAIDASLEDIYCFLARERSVGLLVGECKDLILGNPILAVPRSIVQAYRRKAVDDAAKMDPKLAAVFANSASSSSERALLDFDSTPEACRKLVPFSCLMAAPRIDTVAPFLYQAADFSESVGAQALIRALPPLQPPSPLQVIRRVPGAARALFAYPSGARSTTPRFKTYLNMLQLLVFAAEVGHVNLAEVVERGKPDEAALTRSRLRSLSTAGSPKKTESTAPVGPAAAAVPTSPDNDPEADAAELADCLRRLPMFLASDEVVELVEATVADSPGLLRRCDTTLLKLVHPQISFATCRALGVPSMIRMLREEPQSAQTLERTSSVRAWNSMLQSSDFVHALMRILETEKMSGAASAGTSALSRITAAATGAKVLEKPSVKGHLDALRCERVVSIAAKITDLRQPNVNFAKAATAGSTGGGTSVSAFQPSTSTIFLVLRDEASTDGELDRVSAPFRLAKEINRVLGNAINSVAPLAAVCSMVAQLGERGIERIPGVIDSFDCVNVDGAVDGAVIVGNVVALTEVGRYGKCRLPDSAAIPGQKAPRFYQSYYDPQAHPSRFLVQKDERGVLRWIDPVARDSVSSVGASKSSMNMNVTSPLIRRRTVVVELPAIFSGR